jgi:hypothetical protein
MEENFDENFKIIAKQRSLGFDQIVVSKET